MHDAAGRRDSAKSASAICEDPVEGDRTLVAPEVIAGFCDDARRLAPLPPRISTRAGAEAAREQRDGCVTSESFAREAPDHLAVVPLQMLVSSSAVTPALLRIRAAPTDTQSAPDRLVRGVLHLWLKGRR